MTRSTVTRQWVFSMALCVLAGCSGPARKTSAGVHSVPTRNEPAKNAALEPRPEVPADADEVTRVLLTDQSVFPKCSDQLLETLWRHRHDVRPPKAQVSAHTKAQLDEVSCSRMADSIREDAIETMRWTLKSALNKYVRYSCRPLPERYIEGVPIVEHSGFMRVSSTNNQVRGLDEPDFVKYDKGHLYGAMQGKVRIFDLVPPERAHAVADITGVADPRKLLLDGDRLVVLSSVPRDPHQVGLGGGYQDECAYGYDCDFNSDGATTRISVFDVKDPAQPKRLRDVEMSGSLLTARRWGTTVHVALYDRRFSAPELRFEPGERPKTPREAYTAFQRLEEENEGVLNHLTPEQILPRVTETNAAATAPSTNAPCTVHAGQDAATSFVSLVSFDIRASSGFSRTVLATTPGPIYASKTALYLASPSYVDSTYEPRFETRLHALELRDGKSKYVASGVVDDSVLNQFAMDEYGGRLRVATTTVRAAPRRSRVTVTVLERRGAELLPVGTLRNFAPCEEIRSVRFQGTRGYVVTFKETDPLFVLDLSRPEEPSVLGELKIPGFSTYVHFLDPSHLMSVGFDTELQRREALVKGVLLQIFDVSHPTRPNLLHRKVIGTFGSGSTVLADHLAFDYYAPKRRLALPITVCEGGDPSAGGFERTFTGLMLYDVSLATGFRLRGKISHEDGLTPLVPTAGVSGWQDCSASWAQSTSYVKRSVIADDYVLSITQDEIRMLDLKNPGKKLPVLSLR